MEPTEKTFCIDFCVGNKLKSVKSPKMQRLNMKLSYISDDFSKFSFSLLSH